MPARRSAYRASGGTVCWVIRGFTKKVRKQLFSTTLSSQFTHHCSTHGEQNLLGDIILCINNANWVSKSLCKHLRILGKHRAVIIVIYPLSVVIIYPFAIISFAVTQRACCPDIPRPSASPGHASHQPTSHLPPSHNAPFGMASVCSADLPAKDHWMFKQPRGYLTIFKWPFDPMVYVWANALSWQWFGDTPFQDATVLMSHMMGEINTPRGSCLHIWLALILCGRSLIKDDYQYTFFLYQTTDTYGTLRLYQPVSVSNGRPGDVSRQNAWHLLTRQTIQNSWLSEKPLTCNLLLTVLWNFGILSVWDTKRETHQNPQLSRESLSTAFVSWPSLRSRNRTNYGNRL